ncbi:MAG: hypothetical protein J0H68_02570 [Sphingobacteriia bacterium]|nr:hypothetical protein [Sphingobacteriia bacterium]
MVAPAINLDVFKQSIEELYKEVKLTSDFFQNRGNVTFNEVSGKLFSLYLKNINKSNSNIKGDLNLKNELKVQFYKYLTEVELVPAYSLLYDYEDLELLRSNNLFEVKEENGKNIYYSKLLPDVQNQESVKTLVNKLNKFPETKDLKEEDIRLIVQFGTLLSNTASDIEKQAISEGLEKAIGNMDLNKVLGGLLKIKHPFAQVYHKPISDLRRLIFKLKDLDKLEDIVNRLEKGEKITLKEYSIIYAASEQAGTLFALGYTNNDRIERVQVCLERIMPTIVATYNATNQMKIDTGIILNDFIKLEKLGIHLRNKAQILNKKYISNYSHAGVYYKKLVRNDKGEIVKDINGNSTYELKMGEIEATYQEDALSLRAILGSDSFNIKIDRLINTNKVKNNRLNKEEIEKFANNKFKEIFSNLMSPEKFGAAENGNRLENSVSKILLAGMADYGLFSFHKYLFKDRNNKKIHDQFFGNGISKKKYKLCSQFAAEAVLAAVVELNEQIKKEYGITEDLIQIPFDKGEKLSRVNPGRLYKLLDQAGCIEKVYLPKEIRDMFSDFYDPVNFKDLSQKKIDELFVQAFRQRDELLLEDFKNNPKIIPSEKALKEALSFALKDKDNEELKFLHENYLDNLKSPKLVFETIKEALKAGEVEFALLLNANNKSKEFKKEFEKFKQDLEKEIANGLNIASTLERLINAYNHPEVRSNIIGMPDVLLAIGEIGGPKLQNEIINMTSVHSFSYLQSVTNEKLEQINNKDNLVIENIKKQYKETKAMIKSYNAMGNGVPIDLIHKALEEAVLSKNAKAIHKLKNEFSHCLSPKIIFEHLKTALANDDFEVAIALSVDPKMVKTKEYKQEFDKFKKELSKSFHFSRDVPQLLEAYKNDVENLKGKPVPDILIAVAEIGGLKIANEIMTEVSKINSSVLNISVNDKGKGLEL